MRSNITDLPYLLAAHGLVFSNATGFSHPHDQHDEIVVASLDGAGPPDRTYWIAYDYYVHAREQRALRRARIYAKVREFVGGLIPRPAEPKVRREFREHVRA